MTSLKGNHKKAKINFICLGVGSGFPTRISMILKEKYHNGDPSVPSKNQVQPQFIVDYSTKKPSQLEAAQAT